MQYPELVQILEKRLEVIADHASRDRDPVAHLAALTEVSEAITTWHQEHRHEIDANLELSGASFQKALDYLQTGIRKPCGS